MAETTLDNVYQWEGALLNLSGSAGTTRSGTLAVSDFGDAQSGQLNIDDTDGDRNWDAGESATFDGAAASLVGTGSIGAGVRLLGLQISLGTPVPVNVFTASGQTYVQYPEGDQASLLNGLASQILSTPGIGGTLSLLGLNASNLVTYLEQNAVLTYDITLGSPIAFCFTAGTLIETVDGCRPIEELQIGDLVRTADHGYQPIRWIGRRQVVAVGRLAPIRIEAGALGNVRAMEVSPQHRMLINSWRAELFFGCEEVLVPALHLVNGDTIFQRRGGMAEYIHLLFDHHEVIYAEGIPSESFHPGDVSQGALAAEAMAEIFEIFPELQSGRLSELRLAARRSLKRYEAEALLYA